MKFLSTDKDSGGAQNLAFCVKATSTKWKLKQSMTTKENPKPQKSHQ